ncbi:hypothetical protein ACKWTF_016802 [Chironomus riparius]
MKSFLLFLLTIFVIISIIECKNDKDDHRKSRDFRKSRESRFEMRDAMEEAMKLLYEETYKMDAEERRNLIKKFMRGHIDFREALDLVNSERKEERRVRSPERERRIQEITESLKDMNRRKRHSEL